MNVGDVLLAISEAGLTLKAGKTEDTLKVYPAKNITLKLAEARQEADPHNVGVLASVVGPRRPPELAGG